MQPELSSSPNYFCALRHWQLLSLNFISAANVNNIWFPPGSLREAIINIYSKTCCSCASLPSSPRAVLHDWLLTPSAESDTAPLHRDSSVPHRSHCPGGRGPHPSPAPSRPPCSVLTCRPHGCDSTPGFKYPSKAERHEHSQSSPFRGKNALPVPAIGTNSAASWLPQPLQLMDLHFSRTISHAAAVPWNKAVFSLSNLASQIDLMKRNHHTKTRCPSLKPSHAKARCPGLVRGVPAQGTGVETGDL